MLFSFLNYLFKDPLYKWDAVLFSLFCTVYLYIYMYVQFYPDMSLSHTLIVSWLFSCNQRHPTMLALFTFSRLFMTLCITHAHLALFLYFNKKCCLMPRHILYYVCFLLVWFNITSEKMTAINFHYHNVSICLSHVHLAKASFILINFYSSLPKC